MADYRLGFQSLQTERSNLDLPVEGTIPEWLDGSLYRNGPGKFEAGNEQFTHWFDGLAMLRRFAFRDGAVSYSNRFLRTDTYQRVRRDGALDTPQFASSPSGFFSGITAALTPRSTDNTNVNVMCADETLLALTETPHYTAFDPDTLETVGEWNFDDDVSGHIACAHPVVDQQNGSTLNLITTFGRSHTYRITELSGGSTSREILATIETDTVGYMHSFAVTPEYVVLIEPPLVVNLLTLLNPFVGGSFMDSLSWRPRRGSRFLVIDRSDGSLAAEVEGPSFFYFHKVNAVEEADGKLAIDVVTFEDASVLDALTLDDLAAGDFSHPMGDLDRFKISVSEAAVSRENLQKGHLSLPRINETYVGQPYEYVYSQGASGKDRTEFPTALRKIDVENGDDEIWSTPNRYFGEPIFVPRPDGSAEDDGVVLSVVLDTDRERSGLIVLDAKTFEKQAIAWLPHVEPFDFHGQYFRT